MKRILAIILSTFFYIGCSATQEKEVITIPEGKAGLIGYGSLTSQSQMEAQLAKSYDGPVRVVHVKGYERQWTTVVPNELPPPFEGSHLECMDGATSYVPEKIVLLNIQKKEGASFNAVFFIIDQEDLARMDSTEKGYERVDISNALQEFKVVEGPVYAYIAKPEFSNESISGKPRMNTIPKFYTAFLDSAFVEKGPEYRDSFFKSTVGFDSSLVFNCRPVD